ncbi:DUF2089 family protein [Microbacterium sp. APC 3898]|uniref:DUF2089 family protein n=1 Tax=Planococcus notacanthi TaxID=3035188 RepID=A0ABT7ZHE0_9BACL|nr:MULTISPECIES: DUF2089 family protein [Terrabacteria group]MDN3426575.1 DUF2089 family protein [Planococcus sp. APC 4016]MDN3500462.1 DUF2089 family protein [Microbacterium sp. APC 3898]
MNNKVPEWFSTLSAEDMEFIKKFILGSGSLKEIAKLYGVSYPTVRLRLDKIIQNIELQEKEGSQPFSTFVMKLVIDDKIDLEVAKSIVDKYKESMEE